MKLIIHAGLHKTATTSFQQLCQHNPKELHRCGVHYPNRPGHYQHSWLAWLMQKKELDEVEDFLKAALNQTREANVESTLISGEDFENMLVDWHDAQVLEDIIWKTGFTGIQWIVVTRPSHEYYESLYSELSKHDFTFEYAKMAETILSHGQLTAMNANYCYRFVFDLDRYLNGFRRAISGNVEQVQYTDFVRTYPGLTLLQVAGASEEALALIRDKCTRQPDNTRLEADTIENNYIASFLGTSRTDIETENILAYAKQIREKRVDRVISTRREIRKRFMEAFESAQCEAQ